MTRIYQVDRFQQNIEVKKLLKGGKNADPFVIARAAITEFLDRKERERFLGVFVAEARAAYGDTALRKEALAIAEEALPLDNEALDLAERGPGAQAKPPATRRKRGK